MKTCIMDQVVVEYFMEELGKTTKWTYQSQDTNKILPQTQDRCLPDESKGLTGNLHWQITIINYKIAIS
jgi:hypothetical protein